MINNLTIVEFREYNICITHLKAEEALMDMYVSDFPNSKKEGRRKMHKDMLRQSNPFSNKPKNLDFDKMKDFLNKNGKMLK